MANTKLHDDLVNEVEPMDDTKASIEALMNALADRIDACDGDPVKLTDLKTVLREDPGKVAKAVLANTPDAKNKTQTTSSYDAPSPAFQKPPEGVRQGMVGIDNDHRDQQFPPNSNTEAERERIRRENIATQSGKTVVVNTDMDSQVEANRKAEEEQERAAKAAAKKR